MVDKTHWNRCFDCELKLKCECKKKRALLILTVSMFLPSNEKAHLFVCAFIDLFMLLFVFFFVFFVRSKCQTFDRMMNEWLVDQLTIDQWNCNDKSVRTMKACVKWTWSMVNAKFEMRKRKDDAKSTLANHALVVVNRWTQQQRTRKKPVPFESLQSLATKRRRRAWVFFDLVARSALDRRRAPKIRSNVKSD